MSAQDRIDNEKAKKKALEIKKKDEDKEKEGGEEKGGEEFKL